MRLRELRHACADNIGFASAHALVWAVLVMITVAVRLHMCLRWMRYACADNGGCASANALAWVALLVPIIAAMRLPIRLYELHSPVRIAP